MKKNSKRIIYTAGIILALLCLIYVLLNTSWVQNKIKDVILKNLSEKYDAEFSIGKIDIDFFDRIKAEDILFRDQSGDTLLAASSLEADIGIFNLFQKDLTLDMLKTKGVVSNIYALSDSTYNYSFLFNNDAGKTPQPSANPWDFSLKKAELHDTNLDFKGNGTSMNFSQDMWNISFDLFDLNEKIIKVKSSDLDLSGSMTIEDKPDDPDTQESFRLPDIGWEILVSKLNLESTALKLDLPDASYSLDSLRFSGEEITLDTNSASVHITQLKAETNDGYDLREFEGRLSIKNDTIQIDDLNFNAEDSDASAQMLMLLPNKKELRASGLQAELSYSFLESVKSYLPPEINLLPGRKLEIQAEELMINPRTVEGERLNFRYSENLKLTGNLRAKNYSDLEFDKCLGVYRRQC